MCFLCNISTILFFWTFLGTKKIGLKLRFTENFFDSRKDYRIFLVTSTFFLHLTKTKNCFGFIFILPFLEKSASRGCVTVKNIATTLIELNFLFVDSTASALDKRKPL